MKSAEYTVIGHIVDSWDCNFNCLHGCTKDIERNLDEQSKIPYFRFKAEERRARDEQKRLEEERKARNPKSLSLLWALTVQFQKGVATVPEAARQQKLKGVH